MKRRVEEERMRDVRVGDEDVDGMLASGAEIYAPGGGECR